LFIDNMEMVVFYDIGSAYDYEPLLNEFFRGYGVGLRYLTIIGNIRADLARGPEETVFHFGLGEVF
jgi:outer membrane translocation and assembly module TamA